MGFCLAFGAPLVEDLDDLVLLHLMLLLTVEPHAALVLVLLGASLIDTFKLLQNRLVLVRFGMHRQITTADEGFITKIALERPLTCV